MSYKVFRFWVYIMYKAYLKNLRISPYKVRLVADMVRNLNADEALRALQFNSKRAAIPVRKLVASAVANAKVKEGKLSAKDLKISEIKVDEGATLKRFRFASRGRVHPIRRRSSHISVMLSEINKDSKSKE